MVQHDLLLDEHRGMTLITLDGGKVVFRDGKVGTESECCCGQCCTLQIGPNGIAFGPSPDFPDYDWQAACDEFFDRCNQFKTLFEQAGWSGSVLQWTEAYESGGCGWLLTLTCGECREGLPPPFTPNEPPDPENWLEVPFVNGIPVAVGTVNLWCGGQPTFFSADFFFDYRSERLDANGNPSGSTYIPLCGNPLP